MKVNDAISGGFFILFAGLIFYLTKDFRIMPGQNYGAAFFPRTIAVLMALMGAVLVFQGLRTRAGPWVEALDWVRSPRHVGNFVIVLAVLVFYILFSGWLGFPIAGFAGLLVLLLWLRGPAHWLQAIVVALLTVIAIQYFFGEVLRVPLPWGLLQRWAW